MIESVTISNPKRNINPCGHGGWYPYYAGYSSEFVSNLIISSKLSSKSIIMDPWNGSGTTTTVANNLGFQTHGFDLNPVMVIAAKACLVNRNDFVSLQPLSNRIIELANSFNFSFEDRDPLCIWFRPTSAFYLRKIEKALQQILVDDNNYDFLSKADNFSHISSISAFYYVALFRTINSFLHCFRPTNPTWIKFPESLLNRKGPSDQVVRDTFLTEVKSMLASVKSDQVNVKSHQLSNIALASSSNLPSDSNTIDCIISSPPYCTRIDYAVATMPELTLLGFHPDTSLDTLRRNLIGTSTVPAIAPIVRKQWGSTCTTFLDEIYNHYSKASKTYYYKSHLQYFDSIFNSIVEIERTLKENGTCAIVVQDSHYKNIYNNLPLIFSEMACEAGLHLVRKESFPSNKNMAKRNPEVKKYRNHITASESVLCFKK
jgi:DNA modification methylase